MMLGNNANEGAGFLSFGLPELFPHDQELPSNISSDILVDKMKKFGKDVQEQMKVVFNFMFGGKDTSGSKVAARMDSVINQIGFLCPNVLMIDSFVRLPNRTAYYYQFNAKPESRKSHKWAKGALHHEEVQFLFGVPYEKPEAYKDLERDLSRKVMDDWTNFAKFGRPHLSRQWSPCTLKDRFHLVYELNETRIVNGLPPNRCDQFFDTFYDEARKMYAYYEYRK